MTTIMPPGLCADCGTVDGHREDCPASPLTCRRCGARVKRDALQHHYAIHHPPAAAEEPG